MDTNYFEFEILKADWLKLSNNNRLLGGYRELINIQGEGARYGYVFKANTDSTLVKLHSKRPVNP